MLKHGLRWCLPLLLLLGAGCVSEEYLLRTDPESKAPIKIAALLPISGAGSGSQIWSEQLLEGMQLAEQDLNSKHGINGRMVKLVPIDTCGTSEGAAAAVRQAVDSGAVAMIAGVTTDQVSDIIRFSAQVRMPTVIPAATADAHLKVNAFVYRNSYTDSQQIQALVGYLIFWRKVTSMAAIIDLADSEAYSRTTVMLANRDFKNWGGEITNTTILPKGEISDEALTKLLISAPQAVFISSYPKRAAEIIRKLRSMGFAGILCGPDMWDDDELFTQLRGCDPGECAYTAFFSDENRTPEYLAFRKAFREKFYHLPGAMEAQGYDAFSLLAFGLGSARNLIEFEKNWCTIRKYVGAAAIYSMLPKGDIDRTIYINTIGVHRSNSDFAPYPRLARQIQFSKLQEYAEMYELDDR